MFSLLLRLQLEKSTGMGTWKFVPASFTLPLWMEQWQATSATCQSSVDLSRNLCDLDTLTASLVLEAIIPFTKYIYQPWILAHEHVLKKKTQKKQTRGGFKKKKKKKILHATVTGPISKGAKRLNQILDHWKMSLPGYFRVMPFTFIDPELDYRAKHG